MIHKDEIDDDVRILTGDDPTEGIDPDLPPPGDERRDVLAERKDTLEEAAETQAETEGREAIDPKVFVPEREMQSLLHKHNMLEIESAVAGFEYCWVFTGQHGYFVQFKKTQGWEVVQGDDPECRSMMVREDTTRRLGDVILMRIPIERYNMIQHAEELKRKRMEGAVDSELREIVGRNQNLFKIHENIDDVNIGNRSVGEIMEKKAEAETLRRKAAKNIAANTVIRSGGIPV